jgi:holo-[acyl-carrier protein] synthase
MSVRGIGLDLVEIGRIAAAIQRHGNRFIERFCRQREVRAISNPTVLAQHVAGLFAAKEAVLKALGTGWAEGLTPKQVEIARDAHGRPRVMLHDAAQHRAEEMGVERFHLSITHDHGVAAAVAVAE